MTLKRKPFENIVTSIFSFSHNVFYSSQNKFQFFCDIYFVICKCFQFGPVWKFVTCLRVNRFLHSENLVGERRENAGYQHGFSKGSPFLKMFSTCMTLVFHFNPSPHNDTFWHPWQRSILKTLWEKEKILVTSNFFFTRWFSTNLENFLLFSSNSKLLSADCFNLDQSKICSVVMG